MTTLVLGGVGAAVGFVVSGFNPVGAQVGWALGSAAGAYINRPDQVLLPGSEGPRLSDLRVQSSTYGAMLPILNGSPRVAGNIIWSTDIIEKRHRRLVQSEAPGGKGGGDPPAQVQTTYTYSVHLAIALCEGPIIGVTRIWANNKLIYNFSDGASVDTVLASKKRLGTGWIQLTQLAQQQAKAKVQGVNIRFYAGDETQLQDGLIEAYVGAGNAPAYRGTAYVVFENLQLGEYGNRIPQLEFEVVVNGSAAALTFSEWFDTNVGVNIAGQNVMLGNGYIAHAGPAGSTVLSNVYSKKAVRDLNVLGIRSGVHANRWLIMTGSNVIWIQNPEGRRYLFTLGTLTFTNNAFGRSITRIYSTGDQSTAARFYIIDLPAPSQWGLPGLVATTTLVQNAKISDMQVHSCGRIRGRIYGIGNQSFFGGNTWVGYYNELTGQYVVVRNNKDFGINSLHIDRNGFLWVTSSDPADDELLYKLDPNTGATLTTIDLTGSGADNTNKIFEDSGGLLYIARNSAAGGSSIKLYLVDPTLEVLLAISAEIVDVGQPFGVTDEGVVVTNRVSNNDAIGVVEPGVRITSSPPTLETVVSGLCAKAGLSGGQIDATDLAGDTLRAYILSRQSTLRSALEPLMTAYAFDAVESDAKIKFVKRGGASAVDIPETDVSAAAEALDATQDSISINRIHELELPVSLDVIYLNVDNDHLPGTQSSRRLITQSREQRTLQLPIVLSDDEARRLADRVLYAGWLSRESMTFETGRKYSKFEPTDVVTVNKGALAALVRLTKKDEGVNGIIRWESVLEDPSVYLQGVAGGASEKKQDDTVPVRGTTVFCAMDIPLLRDEDDGPGFYAGAAGYSSAWSGAQIFESQDDGQTWSESFDLVFISASVLGTATSILADFARTGVWDEGGSVDVELYGGSLSSVTRAEILRGINAALLGDEIIQFRTVTVLAADKYRLTGLLRGKKGTEWATGTHAIGDKFALLASGSIQRATGNVADLNNERIFKAVTFGNTLQQTDEARFTDTGVSLKPLSVVHAKGGFNSAGDVLLQWIRRTRFAAPWRDNVDAVLGEAAEAYELDVMSGSVVVRTIAVTSPAATYTVAQQTADFGTPPPTFDFNLYQLSEVYGRGYVAALTV